MTLTWRSFGLSFSRLFLRPSWERWSGPHGTLRWHVTGFGVSLWRDTLPPLTVGERGAW